MRGEGPDRGEGEEVLTRAVDRISHQLKNPLQSISVNLEVLRLRARRDAPGDEDGEVERLSGVIDGAVRTLDRRIGMLVDLARRRDAREPRRLPLGGFVREAWETFRLGDREGGRPLELDVPSGEDDVEVVVRPGWLLALLLGATAAVPDDEEAVVRVRAHGDGAVLELPRSPAGPPAGPEAPAHGPEEGELREAVRRAGGELAGDDGRPEVRFPGA